jgi:hypothetical protein
MVLEENFLVDRELFPGGPVEHAQEVIKKK